MDSTPTPVLTRARRLRRDMTEAERTLWRALRGRRFTAIKFVRQAPVGPFVVDFLCRKHALVVEIDGATHSESREIAYDGRRTAFLEGYRVLRFHNEDVHRRIESVLETILAALEGRY